jgi:hypothetical protein
VFERDAITRAVDLQRRSYQLLRWMTDAIDRGFISYGDAHEFASLSAATFVWIDRHYADLPPAATASRRPASILQPVRDVPRELVRVAREPWTATLRLVTTECP